MESRKVSEAKDAENNSIEYDPFAERNNDHATTDTETLIHFLKGSIGSGILTMPFAFRLTGLVLGPIAAIFTALICTHCSYILVKSSHVLYKRTKTSKMTFAEVAETAFEIGPKSLRGFSKAAARVVSVGMFVTYFGACASYTLIIAGNVAQMVEHYFGVVYDVRMYILMIMVPVMLISYVPNLKYLAPVSMLANVLCAAGLSLTVYYLVRNLQPIENVAMVRSVTSLPTLFSITIFAIEAIGIVMPLENNMKNPRSLLGPFGLISRGAFIVTIIYIAIGFLGYWQFGDETPDNITVKLPVEEIPAQLVKIFITLAVFFSFGLQIMVCIDVLWVALADRYQNHPTVANYVTRTLLVLSVILTAIAVPKIAPIIELIGALCFSILGIIAPVFIEMMVTKDAGYGRFNWMLYKNAVCVLLGLIAMIFGSAHAIEDIISMITG